MPNMPVDEFLGLDPSDNEKILGIKAFQYDIVCNGVELSSGAIRNHRPDVMKKAFAIAGYDVLAGDAADSPWSVSVAERSKPRSDSCSADDCEDGALCRRSWTRRGLSHPSHTYESVGVSAPRFLLIARHSKIVVSRAAPANANHAASGRLSRSATKTATRPQMTGIG